MSTEPTPAPSTPPWRWEDTPGAGIQIYAPIPRVAEMVEFSLAKGDQPVFGMPRNLEYLITYEVWCQFPPQWWCDMQKENAALIVRAVNNHAKLIAAMEDLIQENESLRKSTKEAVAGPSPITLNARAALAEAKA